MKIYYIYKLTVKKHGLFYIGVTCNIDARKGTHLSGINVSFQSLKFKRVHIRKQPVHYEMAKAIKGNRRLLHIDHIDSMVIIKRECSFDVLDIVDTWQDAKIIEDTLIKKHISDPKNLNSLQTSGYCQKIIKSPKPKKDYEAIYQKCKILYGAVE